MKHFRIFLVTACVLILCQGFSLKGKNKEKDVYAFGLAASFNDSVVYCTEIQLLDSVQLDKNGFLPLREMYSYQLKNYVEYELNKPNYTCMIYFSEKKEKLTKEVNKLIAGYKKSNLVLHPLTASEFTFKKPEE